jgi:competence protein CoiA
VIAHCGKQRIWHWKHRSTTNCDRWWEPETEWHRRWKDRFPREWQEIRHHDAENDEIHIADVLTAHGVVIEFQHSRIHPEERAARERFYRNLIWIVDGTRLKRDFPRFVQGMKYYSRTMGPRHSFIRAPEECFPADWLSSQVPVIFDFKGLGTVDAKEPMRETLWCLLPNRTGHQTMVAELFANEVVDALTRGPLFGVPQKASNPVVENVRPQEARTPVFIAPRFPRRGPRRL